MVDHCYNFRYFVCLMHLLSLVLLFELQNELHIVYICVNQRDRVLIFCNKK